MYHKDALLLRQNYTVMEKNQNLYCYKYPHAAVTADCVIFGFDGRGLKILLIERGLEPYKGMWALPGGFMKMDEPIEETARRELAEETGLTNVYLEQFHVFSEPNRDPRERVVTVAFIALVRPEDYKVMAGDDAAHALWFDADMLPPLAFDHDEIIAAAREYLREVIRLKPLAFKLLSKHFTMGELQKVYEAISGANYDRRNFLRTAIDSQVVTEADSDESGTKLYTANPEIDDCDCCCAEACAPDIPVGASPTLECDCGRMPSCKPKKAPTKGLFDFLRNK